ncbi:MAG: hypothetical protein JSW00_14240, partial [Thermoplasmata archaeon]
MKIIFKKICLLVGLAVVICSAIAVVLFLSGDDVTTTQSEADYPLLEPNEKLPNITIGWPGFWPGLVFEFEGPFPEMPDKMMVYKIVYPDPNKFTEAYVRELAEKYFDMPKNAKMLMPGGPLYLHWLKTDMHLFELEARTGFFNIQKYEKARKKRSEDRKDFPSDEECKKIATDYLKSRGLFEDNAYGPSIVDNTSSGVMSVGFGQMVGKYKRSGSAGSLAMNIGPNGEIVKVRKQWLELVPWKIAPIKTAREAFEQLKEGKAALNNRIGGKITKIELRYELPGVEGYSVPVYWFDYSTPERFSYAVVPAVKDEYVE